ncbi:MAG: HdeD family acid-resistance protein, partial [Phormidesmis sp.]
MRETDSERRSREVLEREQINEEQISEGQINREPVGGRSSELSEGSGVGTAIGIGLIILGILAIAMPAFATIASTLVFGWLFVIAGVAQIIYAFWGRSVGQLVWKLVLGVLYLGAGILVLSNVLTGAIALTFVLGVTIFAQGVIQVILAFAIRPIQSWGALLISGVLGVILGILIWSQWPLIVGWLLGVGVGVSLLCDGVWMIMLS